MRKKSLLWLVLAVVAVAVVAGTIWGKNYYEARYVGTDYYAMVPLDFDITPEPLYDMHGVELETGKPYKLTAYNEKGEAKEVSFDIRGEDSAKYPQPGAFLLIKASDQIVLGQSVISESSVPDVALTKIKENQ